MTERMGLAAVGRQNRQRAALARRAELRPAARRLAAVAVGFAGGWAVLYGALMPFGLGFVLGFAEDCFAPCAAGAALGVLLHGFGALSLRSVCMLCALGAAVAARWMGARTLTPAVLAGCGTLVGVALCFAFGGGGAELVFYSAADALLAAAMGFCLRQFAPEKPGAGMLLVGAAAAAALGSIQLWQLLPGVIVCAALELYLCSKGQAKAALAACAVLGAALCAADPALSFAASGLACATAAAAVLAPGRRMETVAAYAGGCVTGALCVQPPGSAFQYLLEKDFLTYRNEELSKRYDTPIYLLQELLQEGENGNPQDAHLAFQGEDGIATDELWSTAQIRQMAVHGWEMLMEYSGLGACGWLERGEN